MGQGASNGTGWHVKGGGGGMRKVVVVACDRAGDLLMWVGTHGSGVCG